MREDPRVQFGREAAKYLTSQVHADQEALAEHVQLVNPNGGSVLDIATGAGHMAFALAPYVDQVVATDPTPQMLEVTADEAKKRGLKNLQTAHAFAEDLPFDPESFDGVSCRVAAHHFQSVDSFLTESRRVLRPGGWFLLVDTVSPEDVVSAETLNRFESVRDPSHQWNLTVSDWTSRTEEAGFRIELITTRPKRMNLQDWMDRMSVPQGSQASLRKTVEESEGVLRNYFDPQGDTFCLLEMTLLAKKPTDRSSRP